MKWSRGLQFAHPCSILYMILASRKLKIFKKLSDFAFNMEKEVKVLALRPGTLGLESQLRISNTTEVKNFAGVN